MSKEWLKHAVIYQIYPQSFLDTNADGIGDLPGVVQKLDYISKLGVNVIWLNPCFESAFFDAGYDVTDYYKVAERYGTNDDLDILISKAKEFGIRVILDLVPGHTSIDHPWFQESKKSSDNEYADCYVWMSRDFDPDEGPTADHYLKSFFPEQPALNYGYAKITEPWQQPLDAEWPKRNRRELKNIMRFWLEKGVSGFRVDMASSLIKNDEGYKETNKLWKGIQSWMSQDYPSAVLIAEWSYPEQAIEAGYDIDFMIHFHKESYKSLFFNGSGTLEFDGDCYFDEKGKGSPWAFIDEYREQKQKVDGRGYISLPTGNHDFQRMNCGRRTLDQIKVPWVFLMTQPGIPTIYYGDEIGMRFHEEAPPKEGSTLVGIVAPNGGAVEGERSGSRTPMQWNHGKNAGFSEAAEDDLYLPIDSSPDFPNVEDQEKDPDSMLHFARKLIKLRQLFPALAAHSKITFTMDKGVDYPLVYERYDAHQKCIVGLNPTAEFIDYTLSVDEFEVVLSENVDFKKNTSKHSAITLRPFSYFIIKTNQQKQCII
jgi:maltose alpha-D-glucosyltransferase/alpha-amylase